MSDVPGSRRARFVVPELAVRPFVGAGCCVFPAAELVCESVGQVVGVRDVACDDALGEVRVDFDPGSDVLMAVSDVLDGLGYPVTAIEP